MSTTFLIIGPSGSGKTNAALTWPRPMLFYDLECKARDALPERLANEEDLEIKQFQEPPSIKVFDMHKRNVKTALPADEKPQAYRNFVSEFNQDWHHQLKEETQYRTVVIDSWSRLNYFANREVRAMKDGIGLPTSQEDYGLLKAKYDEFLSVFTGFPCEFFILIAHEEVTQDDLTKRITYTPWSIGQAIRPVLPSFFSNVWRTEIVGRGEQKAYTFMTESDGVMFDKGKRSIHGIPARVPADWGEIQKLLKQRKAS